MKRSTITWAMVVAMATSPILASAQAPATQPAAPQLPAGHPDISSMNKPAAPSGSLPAGHPDISQMMKSRQSGGAAGSAMPDGMNLPAGHPDLSQMKSPTSQPAVSGVLQIRAVQSTPGGPAVGADPLHIEFYIQGQLFDTIQGKLDEKGLAEVNGVPLRMKPQAIVRVNHAGVDYEAATEFSGANPIVDLQVPVYETTEKAPEWQVKMRHVMLSPGEGGLQVMDMLAVETAGDRAWVGTPIADGKRQTFKLALPAGAKDVKLLGGFDECCTIVEGNVITNTKALVPGASQYQISYMLPAESGKTDLTVAAPAKTGAVMIMVPDDGTNVTADGLQAGGSVDMGRGKTRFYKAADVPAGQELKLNISGIAAPAPVKTSSLGGGSTKAAQLVAGAGALVIVLFGIAFLFIKGSAKKA